MWTNVNVLELLAMAAPQVVDLEEHVLALGEILLHEVVADNDHDRVAIRVRDRLGLELRDDLAILNVASRWEEWRCDWTTWIYVES